MALSELFDKWVVEQQSRTASGAYYKNFVGIRGYKHFDNYVGVNYCVANREAFLNPSKIRRHKFWPFIRFDQTTRRYTSDIEGKLVVKRKNRTIMYASHHDATLMSFYSWCLKESYERNIIGTKLDKSVIGYRKIPLDSTRNKSNIDFAKEVFEFISNSKDSVVLCIDIHAFFDNMKHGRLLKVIKEFSGGIPEEVLSPIMKAVTSYRYVLKRDVEAVLGKEATWNNSAIYNQKIKKGGYIHYNRHDYGIPQGSPISDILANIYMYTFDRAMSRAVYHYRNSLYRRYSDDIILVVPRRHARKVYALLCRMIKKVGLTISENKTEAFYADVRSGTLRDITNIFVKGYLKHKDSLQYLGFEMNLNNIRVRTATISKHYRKEATKLYIATKRTIATKRKPPMSSTIPKSHKYAYYKITSKKLGRTAKRQFRNIRKHTKNYSRKHKSGKGKQASKQHRN